MFMLLLMRVGGVAAGGKTTLLSQLCVDFARQVPLSLNRITSQPVGADRSVFATPVVTVAQLDMTAPHRTAPCAAGGACAVGFV